MPHTTKKKEERKIGWNEVRDGDKLRVEETYSSYGSNWQEEQFFVTAKKGTKFMELVMEDGTEFNHGANSSYKYFLLEPNPIN